MIGSFITMHARLAVRESPKFLASRQGSESLHKTAPHVPCQFLSAIAICRMPDLPIDDEPWKTILQVALRLDDAPRHMGIHRAER